jgi:hypothetical protein
MTCIEELLPSMNEKQRRPFIALYLLFNKFVDGELCSPRFDDTMNKFGAVLNPPSVERLIVALIFGVPDSWTVEQIRAIFEKYFRRRNTSSGIRIPTTLEAGMCLMMVEAYRKVEMFDAAKQMIQFGIENFPNTPLFRTVVVDDFLLAPIDWGDQLLPRHDPVQSPTEKQSQVS